VALAAPGYPCYRNILAALGVEPVSLMTTVADRFQPTPELLDKARADGPIHGLIVASPSNPTGTMLGREELQALVDYCRVHDIRLISDEIYHGITFHHRADTAAEFAAEAIVINSFSKYFAMTGWRLGWMIVPEDLMRPVESLAQNLFISAPTLSQVAAVAAFPPSIAVTSWRPMWRAMRRTASCCWRSCRRRGLPISRRLTALSTFTPMSAI
jgi:aspartate/methionine/tyrosine aminotransferase